jgi:hypothetical protein
MDAEQGVKPVSLEEMSPQELSKSQSKLHVYMQQLELVFAELKSRNRGYGETVTVESEVMRPQEHS